MLFNFIFSFYNHYLDVFNFVKYALVKIDMNNLS